MGLRIYRIVEPRLFGGKAVTKEREAERADATWSRGSDLFSYSKPAASSAFSSPLSSI